jgi:hypothetical protein
MGHVLFILLHLVAVFFGLFLLFLTIPLHLIYAVLSGRSSTPAPAPAVDAPRPETHVRCPECRELVRRDARKCKHCGTGLTPQPAEQIEARADRSTVWIIAGITLVVIVLTQAAGFWFGKN